MKKHTILMSLGLFLTLTGHTALADKRPRDLVLDSWSMTDAAGAYQGQACAAILKTLLKDKLYTLIDSETIIDDGKAHIFFTLVQEPGRGIAVLKCGETHPD